MIARFDRPWRALGARDSAAAAIVLARYAEPDRHYHTLEHIRECLDWFDRVRDQLDQPLFVEVAIWFHDLIYDARAHDNEAKSAESLVELAGAAGISAAACEPSVELILATSHRGEPTNRDGETLVDIDLAILGADPERFARYDRDIRREYAHVPSPLYRVGRGRVLKGFLARDPIYRTAYFRDRLEVRARANLRAALS